MGACSSPSSLPSSLMSAGTMSPRRTISTSPGTMNSASIVFTWPSRKACSRHGITGKVRQSAPYQDLVQSQAVFLNRLVGTPYLGTPVHQSRAVFVDTSLLEDCGCGTTASQGLPNKQGLLIVLIVLVSLADFALRMLHYRPCAFVVGVRLI